MVSPSMLAMSASVKPIMTNKTQWGGARKGAGRPKSPYLERHIKIRCTASEYQEIIKETDPRARTEMLLEMIEKGKDET